MRTREIAAFGGISLALREWEVSKLSCLQSLGHGESADVLRFEIHQEMEELRRSDRQTDRQTDGQPTAALVYRCMRICQYLSEYGKICVFSDILKNIYDYHLFKYGQIFFFLLYDIHT